MRRSMAHTRRKVRRLLYRSTGRQMHKKARLIMGYVESVVSPQRLRRDLAYMQSMVNSGQHSAFLYSLVGGSPPVWNHGRLLIR